MLEKKYIIKNMPQDGLKSSIYRSFVTCDDPKGVVDCRTTRKSKTSSQKIEHKNEGKRKLKSSTSSLDIKPEKQEMPSKRITEELHSPSSFQLREVSREAQKLNQTIESWSKGLSFDGQSTDIAKDLLKGALGLQDSLVMLGKLQEASQYMAHLKKKQIDRSERYGKHEVGIERTHSDQYRESNFMPGFQKPRLSADWSSRSSTEELKKVSGKDEVRIERTYSDQYRESNFVPGFQKPRLSVDGSSRNSTEELKKVIKESLVRQNLLPNTKIHERAIFPPRNFDSASETPSTSSSQSSFLHAATDSAPASAPPQKTKGPNLIAKLMGLGEFPPKTLHPSPQKQFEDQKISNQQRPAFEIDRPKVRKPQSELQIANKERTLKEIIETMQFKGLLRSNSAKELQPSFQHSSHSHPEEKWIDESQPIVLIRPLRAPCVETKKHHTPLFQEEEDLDRRKMLRKLRTKERSTLKAMLKSDKMPRKLEGTPIKELELEGAKEHRVTVEKTEAKDVVEKPEAKDVVVKERPSNKLRNSHPVNHKPQKKEAIEKKADKAQKEAALSRKSLEKDTVKVKHAPKSKEQAKMISSKAKKPDSGSNITKHQISRQSSTKSCTIVKHTTQSLTRNSSDQKKNRVKKEMLVREPTAAKSTKNVGCKEDDKKVDLASESDCPLISTNSSLEDQHPKEDAQASGSQIGENYSDCQRSLCDLTLSTTNHETDIAEEASSPIGLCRTDSKTIKNKANLKSLLLSSPSFLALVKELFDLSLNASTELQTSSANDFGASSMKLSSDCANELVERKGSQYSQRFHPNVRLCITLEDLMEEICNGIETLKNYTKLGGENPPVDSQCSILERDMMCKGFVNGIWESGWSSQYSLDEAEQVVNDIEKLILSGLIEEVFT
nr:uncharacterized protein LOC107431804 isoform X2 [Ziziphus jujuba var. spinosa]